MDVDPKKRAFAESVADYMRDMGPAWDTYTAYDAAVGAVMVLLDDIGAAQGFMDALELPIDLYNSWDKFSHFSFPSETLVREVNMKRTIKQVLKYAAFFLAGSAAAGWAIAEESRRDT